MLLPSSSCLSIGQKYSACSSGNKTESGTAPWSVNEFSFWASKYPFQFSEVSVCHTTASKIDKTISIQPRKSYGRRREGRVRTRTLYASRQTLAGTLTAPANGFAKMAWSRPKHTSSCGGKFLPVEWQTSSRFWSSAVVAWWITVVCASASSLECC